MLLSLPKHKIEMSRRTLQRRLQKLGLRRRTDISRNAVAIANAIEVNILIFYLILTCMLHNLARNSRSWR